MLTAGTAQWCPAAEEAQMSDQNSALQKDPEEWTTGDEPMTAAQESYLGTLAREAGEQLPGNLTKAQASELIDKLQGRSERLQGS
jgi:hypothetical protein